MKIENGRITFLIDQDRTTIELHDYKASVIVARVELTPKQLSQAVSRSGYTKCDSMEFFNADKMGKTMEHKQFDFELPKDVAELPTWERIAACKELADKLCPEGWEHDGYFNSQGSFTYDHNKTFAHVRIRRWV